MRLPAGWNRSRATAAGLAVLLHLVLAAWLLSLRFGGVRDGIPDDGRIWLPIPPPLPPPLPPAIPVESEPPAISPAAPALPTRPIPEVEWAPPDWYATGRAVARDLAGGPERRTFGQPPGDAEEKTEEEEHSVFEQPLPRVGTTVRTPEGETILWVSDRCYVTVGTVSLTMGDIHRARQGVRRCIVVELGGKKKARDDLFEPIRPLPKRLPEPQQEPGCRPGEEPQSCAP